MWQRLTYAGVCLLDSLPPFAFMHDPSAPRSEAAWTCGDQGFAWYKLSCCGTRACAAPHCRCDGWEVLRPNDPGYTYDGVTNGMLGPNSKFRRGFVPAYPCPARLST